MPLYSMPWYLIASLLLTGCLSGFLAGLLGIGGGMILVPFFTWLLLQQGVPASMVVHAAIASALAVILFTSMSSLRAHHKAGAIEWAIVASLAPGIAVGTWLGSAWVAQLPTRQLAFVFGGFVLFSAYQMWANKKPKASRTLPGAWGRALVGTAIGAVSSVVGAGGGFMSVPFMVWCNINMRRAVATSAALGLPIAACSIAAYMLHSWSIAGMPPGSTGYVYWPVVVCIVSTSIFTAPLGAKYAHRWPVLRIKRLFAVVLAAVALAMVYKAYFGF